MHRRCNHWLIVCITGAVTLFLAEHRSGVAGDKTGAAGKPLLDVAGALTDKDVRDKSAPDCYCKAYPVQLQAGTTYQIDLVSTDFDPFLRLEDDTGKQVAEDDDGGGGLNARIKYTAARSGQHKIIASTFKANETGKFKLTVVAVGAAGEAGAAAGAPKDKVAQKSPAPTPKGKSVELSFPAGQKAVEIKSELAAGDATDADKKHFKVFTITLNGGREYRIHMKGGKDLDAYLRLEDETGKRLTEDQFGEPNESGIEFTPARTAPYRIVCSSFKAGMTGGFTLSVAEKSGKPTTPTPIPPTPTPAQAPKGKEQALQLAVGKPVTIQGEITAQDSKDKQSKLFKAYTFQGQAGHTYRFEMGGQAGFDPELRVENASGQIVKNEDMGGNGFSRLNFQPTQGGTYRLLAGAFLSGKTGSFTLTANVLPPAVANRKPTVATMPALKPVLEAQINGELTPEDGTDKDGRSYKVFTFQAKPNKNYQVKLSGQGCAVQVRLEDANGKPIKNEDAFDGQYSRLIIPAGKGETFRVIASALSPNQFGSFTLAITERDAVPAVQSNVIFERMANIKGRLTAEDGIDNQGKYYKVFVIQATAGKYYRCELTAKGFDAGLRLEDAKGKLIRKEDFGDRNYSRLEFKADSPQTYHLVVGAERAGQVGEFTLTIGERDKATAVTGPGTPPPGTPPPGTPPPGTPPAKQPIPPLPPAKQATPPALKGTPFKLADGKSTIDGAITDKDPRDGNGKHYKAFPFAAAKGKTYQFEVTGKGGLDPFVRVEDEAGKRLKDEDFGDGKVSRVLFHAYAAGTYRVVATTFNPGQTGEFTLSAREVEFKFAKAEPLTFTGGKATVQAQLTTADAVLLSGNKVYKEYTFTAEAGKTYKIDLHSKSFDAYLYLKDATGKTLAENDDADLGRTLDSRIVYTAPQAGTYHIIATSLAGGAGPFVLTVGEGGSADKLMSRIQALDKASPAERKQILAEVEKHYKGLGAKLTQKDADQAMRIAETLESRDKQLGAQAYAALGKILAGSSAPNVAHDGKVMIGAARRLNLIGNAMELKGTTTDGKAFDLAKLKGKVVLVDFWATWCPPCKAELPNVRKLYEKYHGKGFEVIGVSLDNKESDLTSFLKKEELPWPSIYKEANGIADDYGVFTIPLPILVGRDGRVLSLNARGAELERLLAEQFKDKK